MILGDIKSSILIIGLPLWLSVKESACQCKRLRFDTWVREISYIRKWQPTPLFLTGKSHEQRSLADYSPWGCKNVGYNLVTLEKAMAPHSSTLALKNPMDGGAWKAAIHGVANSQTRLSDFTSTFHFHALEKEMATHSSVLAWRIPGTGEPGGLLSVGSHRVGHD